MLGVRSKHVLPCVSDADVPCCGALDLRGTSLLLGVWSYEGRVWFSRRHAPSSAACRRREAE
eukprot:4382517-Prymnesium_polylepis.1